MFSTMSISSAPARDQLLRLRRLRRGRVAAVREADDGRDEHVRAGDELRCGSDVGGPDGGRRDVVAERQLDALADGGEVELRPQQRVVDRLGDVAVLQGVDLCDSTVRGYANDSAPHDRDRQLSLPRLARARGREPRRLRPGRRRRAAGGRRHRGRPRPGRRRARCDLGRRADPARLQPRLLRLHRGDRAGRAAATASARPRTTSAPSTGSSASWRRRAGSARSRSSSACAGSLRPGRR